MNNKYQLYHWIQSLSVSTPSPTYTTESTFSSKFVEKIRSRIFSRIAVKCLVEDMKKDLFSTIKLVFQEKTSINFEKFAVKSISELNYEEYQANLCVPEVFMKKISNSVEKHEEIFEEDVLKGIDMAIQEKQENLPFEKFEVKEEIIRKVFGLETFENKEGVATYLKLELEMRKFAEIVLIIRISYEYPIEFLIILIWL